MEAIDLSTPSLATFSAEMERMRSRARRCLDLLDLVDSHVMMCLETFGTSIDRPLEELRQTLETLAQTPTGLPEQGVVVMGMHGYARQCRRQIVRLSERLHALGSAAPAVTSAFFYLREEFLAYGD